MLGRAILLINPPLVNGMAFTRQGRCQERAEVLGTTKPPYSLVVIASLLRERNVDFRLFDQTAERLSTETVIERLEREKFRPSLVVFCTTIPTLDVDVAEMAKLKGHFGAPLVCFGPHSSCAPAESMRRAPGVDAMIVGEPEDAVLALIGRESLDGAGDIEGLTVRHGNTVVPARGRSSFTGFAQIPYPAWDLLSLRRYTLPLVNKPYVLIETSRGCPYSCDFCVVPFVHGHKFRERDAAAVVDEIERGQREFGIEYFYLFGDTVTLNIKSFSRFCDELIARKLNIKWLANGRADNLVDEAFVQKLKESGCWMLSIGVESGSDDTRRDMLKKLEQQKIPIAFRNLRRAGIKSFAFLIYGYPGDTIASMDRTTQYAIDLDADYANFYPAIPYPGTELFEKCQRQGLLATEDWSKLEYAYYVIRGDGLDEKVVMEAIAKARRRFFLRPRYIVRHLGDLLRLVVGNRRLAWEVALRLALGLRDVEPLAAEPARPVSDRSALTP
jgi:anaerobic magnesium-protoporphyrin IX monomethyl ester cyclase